MRTTSRRERETSQERGCRLEEQQIRYHSRQDVDQFHAKINNFHANMAEIISSLCDTCMEKFPILTVVAQPNGITECTRCSHDKHIPKVFSKHNNMDPGPVPEELHVCS